jgi:hypothetical protein
MGIIILRSHQIVFPALEMRFLWLRRVDVKRFHFRGVLYKNKKGVSRQPNLFN